MLAEQMVCTSTFGKAMLTENSQRFRNMKLTLDKLPVGEVGRVMNVNAGGDSITRLMELGLVAGSLVKVERVSPLGCPMAIRLKGTSIAIRRLDAQEVVLEPTAA